MREKETKVDLGFGIGMGIFGMIIGLLSGTVYGYSLANTSIDRINKSLEDGKLTREIIPDKETIFTRIRTSTISGIDTELYKISRIHQNMLLARWLDESSKEELLGLLQKQCNVQGITSLNFPDGHSELLVQVVDESCVLDDKKFN